MDGLKLPAQLACYGLSLLLLWTAVCQFRASLASRYSDRADAAMTFWTTSEMQRDPTQSEINYLEKLLSRSRSLSPGNPTDHERLSQLYLWELLTQSPDELRRRSLHDLGLTEARRFVADEPGWALAWAELLVWKAEFEEIDQEFRVALERATTLGEWHKKIHPAVLQATLPVFNQLSTEDRERVLVTGGRGLRQNPGLTLPILKDFERLSDVCRRLSQDNLQLEKYCESPGRH